MININDKGFPAFFRQDGAELDKVHIEQGEETYVPKVLYSEGPMFRTFVKMLGT